jgi:hypothetical protein
MSKPFFRDWEKLGNVALLLEPFTVDNCLLTMTLKVKRDAVIARYGLSPMCVCVCVVCVRAGGRACVRVCARACVCNYVVVYVVYYIWCRLSLLVSSGLCCGLCLSRMPRRVSLATDVWLLTDLHP